MTATTTGPVEAPRGSLWYRLHEGETRFDFVGRRRIGYAISAVLLVLGLASLATRELNLGIDFEGGVAWTIPADRITSDQVDAILSDSGLAADRIQTLGGSGGDRIRVQVGPQDTAKQNEVRAALADEAGVDVQEVSLTSVGPSWGDEITEKAVRALVVFLLLITAYLSVRLEWRMAIAAIAAVVHDVLITVGIYSLFQWAVTPSTVIAVLTILGFSLYDTIVVFDKVQENEKRYGAGGKLAFGDIVNVSMNQVLMRSINTSLAAVLPVLSLLIVGSVIMGAVALEEFALALLVGLIAGSYSSIYVATPLLATLKQREARWKLVATRLGGNVTAASVGPGSIHDLADAGPLRPRRATGGPRPVDAPSGDDDAPAVDRPTSGPATRVPRTASGTAVPPRPRKKKRR